MGRSPMDGGGNRRRGRRKARDDSPRLAHISEHPVFFELLHRPLSQGDFCVFDIETTGGNPTHNGITEISALRVSGFEVTDRFYTLVNPERSIPPIVRRMTGINDRMVQGAPKIQEVMPDLVDFLGPAVLVSHNTIGDLKFLHYFSQKVMGNPIDNFFLCTHLLVQRLFPQVPDKSLGGLARHFNLSTVKAHRAEDDAILTWELFAVLRQELMARGIDLVADAVRLQGDLDSARRMGWALTSRDTDALPEGAGVAVFHDRQGRVIHAMATRHGARDVRRLHGWNDLPRDLGKRLIHAASVAFEPTATYRDAILREGEMADRYHLRPLPAELHRRDLSGLTLCRKDGVLEVRVGGLAAGCVAMYGPVRDRRETLRWLDSLAIACNGTKNEGAYLFACEDEPFLRAILERQNLDAWTMSLRGWRGWLKRSRWVGPSRAHQSLRRWREWATRVVPPPSSMQELTRQRFERRIATDAELGRAHASLWTERHP